MYLSVYVLQNKEIPEVHAQRSFHWKVAFPDKNINRFTLNSRETPRIEKIPMKQTNSRKAK